MTTGKLADLIEVRRQNSRTTLFVDGEEFPWWTNGLSLTVERNGLPGVTITLIANRVLVDDDMRPNGGES